MRYPVYHYQTPEGFSDFGFIYLFDGQQLTDGATTLQIPQKMMGDSDFLLRHVMGLDTVVTPFTLPPGRVQLYNASGTFMSDKPMFAPFSLPIVPEKLYEYKDIIRFDLYNISRLIAPCHPIPPPPPPLEPDISFSAIAFQGVKRFQGYGYNLQSTYEYREVPQIYTYDLTIDWGHFTPGSTTASFTVEKPRSFVVPIHNWDFELQRILASRVIPGPAEGTIVFADVATQLFRMLLYDSQGRQTSDQPVPIQYLAPTNAIATLTPPPPSPPQAAFANPYNPVFPVPPLLYPAGTQIKFDIVSQLCNHNEVPQQIVLAFQGVWRIPCTAGNRPYGG